MNDRLPMPLIIFLSLLLALLILLFDLSDSYGIVEGVAYIALILLGLLSGRTGYIYLMAASGTVLSLIGYLITSESSLWWVIVTNRGLTVLAIWITAVLGIKSLHREINLRNVIEERERIEEKLREEHQFNVQLVRTAPVIILILDIEGRIIYFNQFLEKLSQYSLTEVRGKNWFTTFLPEEERNRIKKVFDNSLTGIRTRGNSNTIQSRDGNRYLIEWFDNELHDSDGKLIGILAIGMDISERRNAEIRIRDLQNEMLSASRMSMIGELGTALAHELNQPLTALSNYVHACRRILDKGRSDKIQEELTRSMDKVITEADRAASIIKNLRDHFEEGSIIRTREDINQIILDVCELIRTQAEEARVTVTCDLGHYIPLVYIGRTQIQQVLFNLLNNSLQALQRSVRKEIVIKTIRTPGGFVEVQVRDSGPGIQSGLVLEGFKSVFSEKKHGMGVGLSICRSIIDAHGGRLWQTVSPGGGATFHFTVPVVEDGEDYSV